jgi:asparagine synthase (glutamine-hydrolysing)
MPSYITQRPKNPRSHASGLHERVRMYKPMFARIHRSYGQHLHEPVPRDFSVLLRQCGNGPRDHVTDLAGAAKCNARSLIGTLAGPVGIARGAVS